VVAARASVAEGEEGPAVGPTWKWEREGKVRGGGSWASSAGPGRVLFFSFILISHNNINKYIFNFSKKS
jgi:hypothetical protein